MDAYEINEAQERWDTITEAIAKAVKADRELVTYEGWVAHQIDSDSVTRFAVTSDNVLHVNFKVYTQMTGGSYEYPEADIPLDTFNKYL